METSDMTLVTTIIALFSGFVPIIIWLIKRFEKRRQKIVSININDVDLSLSRFGEGDIAPQASLRIMLKRKVLKTPRSYAVLIQNIGLVAVEGMKLAILFPKEAAPLETSIVSEPLSTSCNLESTLHSDRTEMVYAIGRLEKKDRISLSFILDSTESYKIQCQPRGVDDVKFDIVDNGYRVVNLPEERETIQDTLDRLSMIVISGLMTFTFLLLPSFWANLAEIRSGGGAYYNYYELIPYIELIGDILVLIIILLGVAIILFTFLRFKK